MSTEDIKKVVTTCNHGVEPTDEVDRLIFQLWQSMIDARRENNKESKGESNV